MELSSLSCVGIRTISTKKVYIKLGVQALWDRNRISVQNDVLFVPCKQ